MNINFTNEKTLQGLKLSNFFHVKERRFVNAVKEKISNVILEKLQKQELFTLCEIEFDNDFTELESLSNEKKMILSVFHETEVENNILPIYITLHLFTKNLRMYLFNRTLLKEQIARFFTYEEKFFYEKTEYLLTMSTGAFCLDFKELSEEEKLTALDMCKEIPMYLYPPSIGSKIFNNVRPTLDIDWVRQNDASFYQKYRLLFE